ncbi:MAG: helix-turn-helix transcriptional regulator [Anaerolineae bacterium]
MQVTRQRIIDLLRKQGYATVEELAQTVGLTQMAVRHHINVLQAENLIEVARTRRQPKPGRPIQVYGLTEKARKLYPQEYIQLTDLLVAAVIDRFGQSGANDVFNSMANSLVEDAPPPLKNQTFEDRLSQVVTFLQDKGFVVEWGTQDGRYIISHLDCPYRKFAQQHREVCLLDKKVIGDMLHVTPKRVSCIACNDDTCTYILSQATAQDQPATATVSP